jgi:hypothetical protein
MSDRSRAESSEREKRLDEVISTYLAAEDAGTEERLICAESA